MKPKKQPFWITGTHPITGHVIKSAVERRQRERPARLKKLKEKSNWI